MLPCIDLHVISAVAFMVVEDIKRCDDCIYMKLCRTRWLGLLICLYIEPIFTIQDMYLHVSVVEDKNLFPCGSCIDTGCSGHNSAIRFPLPSHF